LKIKAFFSTIKSILRDTTKINIQKHFPVKAIGTFIILSPGSKTNTSIIVNNK